MEKIVLPYKPISFQTLEGITGITVSGFKSITGEQAIEIRPLTILAGANSSGKSSIVQPLLLLKQTLEASYDPGALLLHGPNIKFTLSDQLLAITAKNKHVESFTVGIEAITSDEQVNDDGDLVEVPKMVTCKVCFGKQPQGGFNVRAMTYEDSSQDEVITLRQGMSEEEIYSFLPEQFKYQHFGPPPKSPVLLIVRDRCYLRIQIEQSLLDDYYGPPAIPPASRTLSPYIQEVIHIPGLRGNPERAYPVTAVGSTFSGTFENYVASVISHWQAKKEEETLKQLNDGLARLGLTWSVVAKRINDTQVELQVGRLPKAKNGTRDLVNIADVGFGVSQTLPVLVALLVAKPGQLVYLEQPEIHLHPRAQTALAQILADAAMRGVRVVAETHSSLLLLGIQTLVAEGKLPSELVKLHWFTRGNDGATTIRSGDLDETGAFGDWPEDFADVELAAESRYLDAAEARQRVH